MFSPFSPSKVEGLHLDEIDHAFELVFRPIGNVIKMRIVSEAFREACFTHAERVGARAVHFIDEARCAELYSASSGGRR